MLEWLGAYKVLCMYMYLPCECIMIDTIYQHSGTLVILPALEKK